MKTEDLGMVYYLSVENVNEAIRYWLTEQMNQKVHEVVKIEVQYTKEYYQLSNFEQDYTESFNGIKVFCKREG